MTKMKIDDGKGSGKQAQVDSNNRLRVQSVTLDEQKNATDEGDSYNINTGEISISAESAILYMKNNEDNPFIVDSIALGVGTGTTSDIGELYLVKNPTGGSIVSNASAVDMNENRNFGSSNVITADTYKGASGNTFSDGSDMALFYQGSSGRLFANIGIELTKGDSVGFRYQPNLSAGSTNVYAAIIGHLK
jgi:hypothetical protein